MAEANMADVGPVFALGQSYTISFVSKDLPGGAHQVMAFL
jgi:hypothetical protein